MPGFSTSTSNFAYCMTSLADIFASALRANEIALKSGCHNPNRSKDHLIHGQRDRAVKEMD